MTQAGAARPERASIGRGPFPAVNMPLLLAAFGALMVMALLGPLMSFGDATLTGEGSPLRQGGYLAIAGVTLFSLRPWHDPARLIAVPLPIVVALAWCLLSVTWAVDPNISIRRLALTAIILWSIFAAIPRLGYERTVILIRGLLVAAVIANYIAVFGFPSIGIHQANESYDKALIGDWRGILQHKNIAGAVSAMAVLFFTFDRGRMPRWLQIGVIAIAAVFLVKSGSRTSLGVCAAALAVGLIFLRYNARYRLVTLWLACIAGLGMAVYVNIYNHPFTQDLNDKTAFTGRTQIWDALGRYIGDHPLGAGYNSFWNIGPDSPIYQYATNWVIEVAEGHNGFLDLAATIGIPGLIIVLVAAVIWPLTRLFAHPSASGPRGALVLSVIVFCVSHNSTESSLFDRDTIVWVFLSVALALLWTITGREARMAGRRISMTEALHRRARS